MDGSLSAHEVLAFSHHLANHARSLILQHFRSPMGITRKEDASVVTEIDRQVEIELRQLIHERFPNDGIIGEEYGGMPAGNSWILDPIDGTANFVLGNPLFGTLIGLLQEGQPFTGLIDAPATAERWAGDGRLTIFSDRSGIGPVRVSPCRTLASARLYLEVPHSLRAGQAKTFYEFSRRAAVMHSSCDCYAYGLLASGYCDLVIEDGLEPYDYLPIVPVVLGAGGCMTDWQGNPLDLNSGTRVVAAATQPLLLEAVNVLTQIIH